MKTSITARLAAIAASLLVTIGTVHLIADYALPEEAAKQLAQSAPRR